MAGFDVVRSALAAPLLELARNGGHDPDRLRPSEGVTSFDVLAGACVDAERVGPLDAVAMVDAAVTRAAAAVVRYIMIH